MYLYFFYFKQILEKRYKDLEDKGYKREDPHKDGPIQNLINFMSNYNF